MKKLHLALVLALSLSGAAQAFDLNGMLSSGSDLLKAATDSAVAALQGDLAKRDTTINDLQKRLAALEAQPLPAKGPTRVVGKAEDGGGEENGTPAIPPVRNADGSVDQAATEVKKLHALTGPRLVPSAWYRPRR